MLRYILVETTMFGPGDQPEETEKDLCWWLEALTQRNQDYLKQRPSTPRLYKSGVRYDAPQQFSGEPAELTTLRRALGRGAKQRDVAAVLEKIHAVFGGEHFCDIGTILKLGKIDCDGLACYRAAELRQAGIQARPVMTSRKRWDGGTTYHALVQWPPIPTVPYESREDPSLLLGMGGPARAAERAEEIRKNQERCEIIAKYGIGRDVQVGPVNLPSESELEAVLGTRPRFRPAGSPAPGRRVVPGLDDAVREMETMLRGVA